VLTNRGQTGGEAVGLHELPAYVGQAVVASEDRRYYSHFGVDPIGLVSVAIESIRSGNITRGASTITQQVAKNLFLTPEQSMKRKVQEALLAVWLERNYTKDQILELYLNRVHFGSGATGIISLSQLITCLSMSAAAWSPPPRLEPRIAASKSPNAPVKLLAPIYHIQNRGWMFSIG
jgi:penicillin-binding protein 1A